MRDDGKLKSPETENSLVGKIGTHSTCHGVMVGIMVEEIEIERQSTQREGLCYGQIS